MVLYLNTLISQWILGENTGRIIKNLRINKMDIKMKMPTCVLVPSPHKHLPSDYPQLLNLSQSCYEKFN